jgi:MoaA/NifB/PqqE/SkfB family radical SAM enzyme
MVDTRPWAAHLYVTDQCNLDCHYCNEYDNSVPHPPLADLKRWMRKIRDLGALRLGFQGGEPLMHPDIVEVVRTARHELGFHRVSMSTNGFKLTQDLARDLGTAGLDVLQFSVDRMTPIPSTRKSLKSVAHKLEWFAGSPVRVQVAGVLFDDTIEEMKEVIDECVRKGVRVHARVAHEDLVHGQGVKLGRDHAPYVEFLDMEARRKLRGEPIHSDWNILAYQRGLLTNERPEWKCVAGYKYFFVSARGKFWLCSQVRTEMDIMDVTPEVLRGYDHAKDCQTGCGVYCIIGMSLAMSDTKRYLAREAAGRARTWLNTGLTGAAGASAEANTTADAPVSR